jgi:hypothetical protein
MTALIQYCYRNYNKVGSKLQLGKHFVAIIASDTQASAIALHTFSISVCQADRINIFNWSTNCIF